MRVQGGKLTSGARSDAGTRFWTNRSGAENAGACNEGAPESVCARARAPFRPLDALVSKLTERIPCRKCSPAVRHVCVCVYETRVRLWLCGL